MGHTAPMNITGKGGAALVTLTGAMHGAVETALPMSQSGEVARCSRVLQLAPAGLV